MAARIYYSSSDAAPITPAYDAVFEGGTNFTRRKCSIVKSNSNMAIGNSRSVGGAAPIDACIRQYISDPMEAQTINGTVKGQILCLENAAAADMCRALVIRVLSGDGLTVRGTLLTHMPAALTSEFNASSSVYVNRYFPPAGEALTEVVGQAGDRLCIEIGFRRFGTHSASYSGQMLFGDNNATDLPEDETTNVTYAGTPPTANNAWLEFSMDIAFEGDPILGSSEVLELPYGNPVYLFEIQLTNSGPMIYVSDRAITIGSQQYEAYIKAFSNIDCEVNFRDATFLNSGLTIEFTNEPYDEYDFLSEADVDYPFEGAEVTIREVYCDLEGTVISATAPIYVGILEQPKDIVKKVSFKCEVSSKAYYYDKIWKQKQIDLATYAGAWADAGKVRPIIYGDNVKMRLLKTDEPGISPLTTAEAGVGTGTWYVSDTSRFPGGSFTAICDGEEVTAAVASATTLTISARNINGTTAATHEIGHEVVEKANPKFYFSPYNQAEPANCYMEYNGNLIKLAAADYSVTYGSGTTDDELSVDVTKLMVNEKTAADPVWKRITEVHAEVDGYTDPDGNYGGSGTLIKRPDLVIKHFLVQVVGFDLDEIDVNSFSDAGIAMAAETPGYEFAFAITEAITPSQFVQKMARECRSVCYYRAGKWYLYFNPNTIPDPAKTVSQNDLAGPNQKFHFSVTPKRELCNDLLVQYNRNYSKTGYQSNYQSQYAVDDATSQAKNGVHYRNIEFDCIKLNTTAENVGYVYLFENWNQRLYVEFIAFWDHFDLNVTNTFDIESDIYNGLRFIVEKVTRIDSHRVKIRALSWRVYY